MNELLLKEADARTAHWHAVYGNKPAYDSFMQQHGITNQRLIDDGYLAAQLGAPAQIPLAPALLRAMDAAWQRSGHGTPQEVEHEGSIIQTAQGGTRYAPAPPGISNSPLFQNYPVAAAGEARIGTFHTHQYDDPSLLGASFSSDDIDALASGFYGVISGVHAGTDLYFLRLDDPHTAQAALPQMLQAWQDAYDAGVRAGKRIKEASLSAVAAALAVPGSGVSLYHGPLFPGITPAFAQRIA